MGLFVLGVFVVGFRAGQRTHDRHVSRTTVHRHVLVPSVQRLMKI